MSGVLHAALVSAMLVAVAGDFAPARRLRGPIPPLPPANTVGWIDDRLELQIDAAGSVDAVGLLQQSPLPDDILTPAVRQWQFRPAEVNGRAVPTRLLVAAIYRPPALFNNPTAGNPPARLAEPSAEIPFPLTVVPPAYPPLVASDALVLLEVKIGADGSVLDAQAMAGAPPFTHVSVDAVRRWTFRPAARNGRSVDAYAYVLIGFRQPLAL